MIIMGKNAVKEAILNGDEIEKILIASDTKGMNLKDILKLAGDKRIVKQYVPLQKLKEITRTEKHQGIIAFVSEYKYFSTDDIINEARSKDETPFIIMLDQLTDPHNFGAIIRTAEACGAHGIIIPKRNSVFVNETVTKTSAGATTYVKISKATNLNNEIEYLKKNNIWVYSLDMDGDEIYKTDFKGGVVLVIGSEGEGIRKSILENSDFRIKIPMSGKINSLNASVAAGISMYEVLRQRNT